MRRGARLKLSVVVPVVDEAACLTTALGPLQRLRGPGLEIIVVDGGSRDATREVAAPLADRVLFAPRGRAVQMNTGASVAQGDALLFLHADCTLPANAVKAMAAARATGHRWGRFDVRLDGESTMLPVVAMTMNARSRLTGICTGDQGLFVDRDVFEAAGGFPALPLMEDVALSHTLKATAGPPACLRDRVTASGRRWDRHGAWRTIMAMWRLRFAYWHRADVHEIARRYYGTKPRPAATLQVFAKPPLPGRVKTRLATSIGADAAAEVYARLVQRTLDTAAAARRAGVVGEVEVWVAPGDAPGALAQWIKRHSFTLRVQQGDDLGARMRHALCDALARNAPALLIGTDVPDYDVAYLAAAAAALQASDAVVGPAEDGGYVLIGLARDLDAFDGVPWSTAGVMSVTRARLAAAGATWRELPTLWDLDTSDDLARWQTAAATTQIADRTRDRALAPDRGQPTSA